MLNRRVLLAYSAARVAGSFAVGAGTATRSARAATLAAPTGKVLLTVRGKIAVKNAPDSARFDLAMLDALPQGRFEGDTPWTKGNTVFTGPLGSALLDAVGANGTLMRVEALNDYSADVPISDFYQHAVIVATRRDGSLMSVREKGPLWVIYPMDREPALRNETTYTRSVWQVSSIDIS